MGDDDTTAIESTERAELAAGPNEMRCEPV